METVLGTLTFVHGRQVRRPILLAVLIALVTVVTAVRSDVAHANHCTGDAFIWQGDTGNDKWYGSGGPGDTNWGPGNLEPGASNHVCVGGAGIQPSRVNQNGTIASLRVVSGGTVLIPEGVILRVTSEVINEGTIILGGANAELRIDDANSGTVETLTNNSTGTISIPAGGNAGPRYIGGDVDNQGTITVAHPEATFAPRGESRKPRLTNAGTLTVATGGELKILNANLRQAAGGTINGPGPVNVSSEGPFSNFSVLEIAGGAIDPGADVNLTCCGFNAVSFVAGSAGATGNIDVQFGQHPITGNVPAGVSIDVEGGGRLEAQADYTNAGTITLTDNGAEVRTENGANADTETLTNTGTIAIPAGGTAGLRSISGNLLNQGTISVAHAEAVFQPRSESRKPTLTNAATINVATGGQLEILNAILRQAGGGTINGPGPVNVSSSGPFSNFSVLEIAGGAIDPGADVNLTCCGFNTVSFVAGSATATGNIDVQAGDHPITGNVPAGISIDVEGGGRLNSQSDYTNAGTITLNGADAEIRTANGTNADTETLTNTGTIAYSGSTGIEYIGGDLLNQGTITVAHPEATFAPRGESRKPRLTNAGTINVATGSQLKILNANLRQTAGGTINGPGPVNVSSEGPFSNFSVIEIAGGAIDPGADVNLTCCGFNAVSFIAGSAGATGNIDVHFGQHPITGNVPAGISIDVEGGGRLEAQADYTNAGTITLLGADAEVRTENGNNANTETLTNTGTIAYAGSGGTEYISGDLLNQGTISVDHPDAHFQQRSETRPPKLTNAASGTLTVAAGDQLSGLAGSTQAFENAGDVQVAGRLIMPGYAQTAGTTALVGGPPAEVSISGPGVLALQGGTLEGAGTVGPDVNNTGGTVSPGASPGILTVVSDYTQASGGTLAVEINGPDPGTGYDQLQVGDEVSLAGTLTVDTAGFAPAIDQQFEIIDAPAPPAAPNVTGTFATVEETGRDYDVIYNPTDVTLEANPPLLTVADRSVTEGAAGSVNARFRVELSSPSDATVTVDYATSDGSGLAGAKAPGDYTATSGTLSFVPGDTVEFINVAVQGDLIDEVNERYDITLSNPALAELGDPAAVGTIIDDDPPPSISITDSVRPEGGAAHSFTVSLSGPSSQHVRVDYATANASATAPADYSAKTGSLVFAPGQTTKEVAVSSVEDALDEAVETFTLGLSNPVKATIADSSGLGTIIDDDLPPSISITDVTRSEGANPMRYTVTLSAASAKQVKVDYATADAGATNPDDYGSVGGTLSFSPGQTSKTVVVDSVEDLIDEPNETYTLDLSNPFNATFGDNSATGTIVNDD